MGLLVFHGVCPPTVFNFFNKSFFELFIMFICNMESRLYFNIVTQSSVNGLFATKTVVVSNNTNFRVYLFHTTN